MRACMVSAEYAPNIHGGLGRHVTDLTRSLAAQGVQVHVVTPSPGGDAPDETCRGECCVHRVSWPLAMGQVDWDCRTANLNCGYVAAVLGIARTHGFDILHGQDWSTCQALVALRRVLPVPIVSTVHIHSPDTDHPLRAYRHSQIAALLASSDALICCSEYMRAELERLFACPARVAVVPNGVYLDRFPFVEAPGNDILFVGRLVPRKGVHDLIRAYAQVHRRVAGELVIVGSGAPAYEAELCTLARDLGVAQRVRFVGQVENERLAHYMARARVAAIPSLYEPFGIVALEAMASGVPVVAYATGGLAEIVQDGINGLQVPPGDVGALAERLAYAYTHDLDDLRRRARQDVETKYTWRHVAQQTASLYRELL